MRWWQRRRIGVTDLIAAMESALDLRRARIHMLEQQLQDAYARIEEIESHFETHFEGYRKAKEMTHD